MTHFSTTPDLLNVHKLEDYQLRDVQKLIDLFVDGDIRTIEEMIAEEVTSDHVIEKVGKYTKGEGQEIHYNPWTTFVTGPEVKVGDTVSFFDEGQVNGRHGWALNGEIVEFQTPFERHVERLSMLAGFDRSKRERYAKSKEDVLGWIEQLTGKYAERIERFKANPAFLMEGGGYEVYPVLMAQRVQAWCEAQGKTIEDFRALDHEKQSVTVHGGERDKYGISGHQFDSAVAMAGHVMAGGDI